MRSTRTTVDKMLDAAAEMFSKKGYAATTFRDVASEGAINNNSIFRRILNKADLAKQALKWEADKIQFNKILHDAQASLHPDDPSNVKSLIAVLVKTVTESRLAVLCLRSLEGECDPEITQYAQANFIVPVTILLEAFLRECIHRQNVRPLPITMLAQTLLGPIQAILVTEFHFDKKAGQSAETLADIIVENWLRGVKTEEAV